LAALQKFGTQGRIRLQHQQIWKFFRELPDAPMFLDFALLFRSKNSLQSSAVFLASCLGSEATKT
jgi:hypothetical protein